MSALTKLPIIIAIIYFFLKSKWKNEKWNNLKIFWDITFPAGEKLQVIKVGVCQIEVRTQKGEQFGCLC